MHEPNLSATRMRYHDDPILRRVASIAICVLLLVNARSAHGTWEKIAQLPGHVIGTCAYFFNFDPQCGEIYMIRKLKGVPILRVSQPVPNPVTGLRSTTSLNFTPLESVSLVVRLYDARGREVTQDVVALHAGQQQSYTFDLNSLSSGVYRYSIESLAHDIEVIHGSIVLEK